MWGQTIVGQGGESHVWDYFQPIVRGRGKVGNRDPCIRPPMLYLRILTWHQHAKTCGEEAVRVGFLRGISRARKRIEQEGLPSVVAKVLRKMAARIEYGDLNHQLSAYRALSRYMPFEGMRILEVGGDQSCESAIPFMHAGGDVTVSGLDHITEVSASVGNKPAIMRADALALSKLFPPSYFDVIYGLSIIEHIPSPDLFLKEAHAILRPGGLAYFEGRPLWSGPEGHHVWVSKQKGKYKDIASANYFFTKLPGIESVNPLPNWAQLLMSESQMSEHLVDNGIPRKDIECIIDCVFRSERINRLGMSEIARAYSGSEMHLLEANVVRFPVPSGIELALRELHGSGVDYGVTGISYVLTKPRR